MKHYQASIKSLRNNIKQIEFVENSMKMKITYKNGNTQMFKYQPLKKGEE